jgi:GNAT superfamily N-acetyltransferase
MVAVRLAGTDDTDAVSRVLSSSYPILMAAAYDSSALLSEALPLIVRANPKLLRSGNYFVAEADDEVIGCGGWSLERPGTGEVTDGIGHIRHFATRADRVGRGVGRALYAACEAQARAAGVKVFECYSTLNAQGFYSSLGFAPIGRIDVLLSDSVKLQGVHMRREI